MHIKCSKKFPFSFYRFYLQWGYESFHFLALLFALHARDLLWSLGLLMCCKCFGATGPSSEYFVCWLLIIFELGYSDIMEDENKAEFKSFLKVLPPVEFACVYGSSLHPNNQDKVLFWLKLISLLHYYLPNLFFFPFLKLFTLNFVLWLSSQPWRTIFLVYQIPCSGILR